MKYHNERRTALLTAILVVTVLFYSLILPASASALTAAREDHGHPRLQKPIAFEMEDGKVTDGDGIIGNSLHGADAAHHRHAGSTVRGMKNAADRMVNDAKGAAKRAGESVKRAADDAMNEQSTGNTNANANADRSGSIIGWIVAVLIILAIALIVLAMLPKKNRNRR